VSRGENDRSVPPGATAHFSNLIPSFVASYLEHRGGEELVVTVLREAGETREPASFRQTTVWSSYDQLRRLLEATDRSLDTRNEGPIAFTTGPTGTTFSVTLAPWATGGDGANGQKRAP
jgi:hypothetical protein